MTSTGHTSFSAADLERVVAEARPRVVGARVQAVTPRGREGFFLSLETAAGAPAAYERLLVALEPGVARAHLEVERAPRVKAKDRAAGSPFLDRLGALLLGARVQALEEVPGDRVLRIVFEPPPAGEEARTGGAGGRLVLWLSFFAVRADAVLEEEPSAGGDGGGVSPPRQQSSGAIVASLRAASGRPLLSAGAAPRRAPLFPDVDPDAATLACTRALASHFAEIEAERAAEETARALASELSRRRRRAEGARLRLAEAVVATSKADEQQRMGEMLLASLHLVRRGASEVLVPDYWQAGTGAGTGTGTGTDTGTDEAGLLAGGETPMRRIELDPSLAPAEQAGRYFKAAKKARRGAEVTRTRLAAFTAEIAAIDEALAALASGASPVEVARRAKIPLPSGEGGPSRVAPSRAKPRAPGPGGPRRYRSKDGLDILVGRSNRENDELTTKIARSEDLFFHVSGFPGSHVIARAVKGKSVPLETLLDAAALAVHFSKARGRVRTEVGYTPRKWVRKPRGAKPGLVIVERQKTIVVAGAEERLARLLAGPEGAPEADPGGAAE